MGARAHAAPVLLIALTTVVQASAAGVNESDWGVGLNEMWIAQTMLASNSSICPGCPGNMQPRTLAEATCRLLDLAGQQHVGVFREIVPFSLVQPDVDFNSPTNQRNRALILAVLQLYAGYNSNLIFTFGLPLASWMPINSGWCPIPPLSDPGSWALLKNSTSWLVGQFVHWVATESGLPAAWVQSKFFVEPWNEFDASADTSCTFPSTAPSPERMADLSGGVNFVLHALNTPPVSLLAPSVTGSYPGVAWAPYLARFRNVGGVGTLNVHGYACDPSVLESIVQGVLDTLPGPIIVGETGCALQTAACSSGVEAPDSTRAAFFQGLASNPGIQSATQFVVFWRTLQLSDTSQGCEATYGLTSADDSSYFPSAAQLFQSLGGTGASKSCAGL